MTDEELKTLDTLQSIEDIYANLGSEITNYSRKVKIAGVEIMYYVAGQLIQQTYGKDRSVVFGQ